MGEDGSADNRDQAALPAVEEPAIATCYQT